MLPDSTTDPDGILPLEESRDADTPATPAATSGPASRNSGERDTTASTRSRRGKVNQRRGGAGTSSKPTPGPSLDAGTELEMRHARLLFWEGSYARRGINLQRHFDPEPLLVTDLDLLAISFSPQLRRHKTIGEAKTGTSKNAPKPLDRAIWLAGLMRLVGADAAELTTALEPSRRVQEVASSLGVRAMSIEELTRREQAAEISPVADIGAHGPTAVARVTAVHAEVKGEDELERAYWFLRSEVWFLEPWPAVKRTIGLLRRLSTWWAPKNGSHDESALRWLYAESLSVLTLNLVTVIEPTGRTDPGIWATVVHDRLAEGVVPMHQMRALSGSVDSFVTKVLAETNAPAQVRVEAMGAFLPRPPDYADAIVELTRRLAALPSLVYLPRHVDLIVHERLVRRRHVSEEALGRVSEGNGAELARARRLVAAFLRGNANLPDAVDKAMVADTTQQDAGTEA